MTQQVPAFDTTNIKKAEAHIRDNFFDVDEVIKRLGMFVVMNSIQPRSGNIIFWGKGGYGKSEIVSQYLQIATGEEPYVVNMNQATTTADLWGGVDLPAFTQGQIKYNVDNSFMKKKWVIMEEGLEPRQKVLSSLKYLITAGVFSQAGVVSPMAIETLGIIIVTNVDTADFLDSDDTKAFLERFPIQYKVGWEKLNHSQRYDASLKVVGKFDQGRQLSDNYRRLIAENASTRLESPRQISRVVQAMLANQAMCGGGWVTESAFTTVMSMFGWGDKNLAAKIEAERIEAEIRDAKSQYEALFDKLKRNMEHYKTLKSHLNEPEYITRMAKQIVSTIKLMDDISESVVDIRTNPNFGQKGNELASWINAQVGTFSDQLEDIKHDTWDGLMNTVDRLVNILEKEGIKY